MKKYWEICADLAQQAPLAFLATRRMSTCAYCEAGPLRGMSAAASGANATKGRSGCGVQGTATPDT